MKDTYLNCKLVQPDLIRLVVFSSLPWEKIEPTLVVDHIPTKKLKPTRLNTLSSIAIADFRLESELELGHSYCLIMPQYGSVPIDVCEATGFPGFDEKYYYEGDDLGATYGKKETRFAIWAPLASRVVLGYRKKGCEAFSAVSMKRTEKGVYRATLPGDHHLTEYRYFVTNGEVTKKATDPYAKGSMLNGENSVVVDFSRLKTDFQRQCLPIMESYSQAVIYETHVRDMTISPDTDIKRKGTFLGLVEEGRKTAGGNPAGFDHIRGLGVTHVQLLPIYDFKTVDESNPASGYNWGYDPAQYFVPEGSYASDLQDPLSRIRDCKAMVAAFHKKGIRVVMDVVYNHVFEYENSVFERVVPNYYFRHKSSGQMANTSGCGDDLASERPMVRKLIVDACRHWIEEYGIDGFRFDLMGIMDVDTLKEIARIGFAAHKSFIVYGEGWNMGGEVKAPLGHMGNYRMLPEFGFFNDYFRESMKRLFVGDRGALGDCKNVLCGSCTDFIVGAKFLSANQTVNYVECHDNATFFDYLAAKRGDLPEETRLRIVEEATETVLFGLGIPFIHMGQEIGLTKFGEDNTYNKGDHFNQFDYRLLDARIDMCHRVEKAIALRKSLRFFHIFDPRVIGPSVAFTDHYEVLRMDFVDPNLIGPRKGCSVWINPSPREYLCPLPQGSRVLFGDPSLMEENNGERQLRVPAWTLLLTEAA
ncbi:MAG: type I pullulanase [Bacilli bacterium]|nr:type I pullulanase [Bacilli bacterium]